MQMRYRRLEDLIELTETLRASRYGLSITDLKRYFGVSRRTVERMLLSLRSRDPGLNSVRRGGQKF
jgi:predicted DNA-binding transcriptional regulator YafY